MPSVLHILRWSMIRLWCFFLVMRICTVTILPLIPVHITESEVTPLDFRGGLPSPADGGDVIAIVTFITLIFVIPAAPWHPEMKFVIRAIVVYRDVWVNTSDLMLLKCHFGRQIIKENTIVNTHCLHTDHHGRRWVLCLLDVTLDCSKSVVIHPLLIALR